MANTTFTNSGTFILINFGDIDWHKTGGLQEIEIHKEETHINLKKDGIVELNYEGETYPLSYNSNPDAIQVDLVDGVAPTSNEDLKNKLRTLRNSII